MGFPQEALAQRPDLTVIVNPLEIQGTSTDFYSELSLLNFALFCFAFISHVEMACGIIHVVLKKVDVVIRRTSKSKNRLPVYVFSIEVISPSPHSRPKRPTLC